ncbi:hypothetical protein Q8W71_10460 [Methylobacterium sp. NEAU 140]|uniref:hypothetical protein n=1 Tax=Methylobacterium sp. NEAU 140 TaxID=3064945 RepID=UPI002732DE0F|nr:hypothetical protein [Methylobacterium sp. NEAU 140]MDP4023046.1 hypothetical protein [Methylobacterium sp. NEAU 140]
MASLDQTLRIFADLLAAEPPVPAGPVDEAVWAYLAAVPGLSAQIEALDRLRRAAADLDADSPVMPMLRDILDRHRARLDEGRA